MMRTVVLSLVPLALLVAAARAGDCGYEPQCHQPQYEDGENDRDGP